MGWFRQERRKHPRIPLTYVAVDVYPGSGDTKPCDNCPIINLSEGGLRIGSQRQYEEGQVVRITFTLPGNSIAIRATATVLRKDAEDSRPGYGLQFNNMGPGEKSILRVFISRALHNQLED
jgi:hypothetical protein